MKIHDLAFQLELLAKFLRSLPNAELKDTDSDTEFVSDRKAVTSATDENKKTGSTDKKKTIEINLDQVVEQFKTMTSADVEIYLNSESDSLSSVQLQQIAAQLGISTSKRQSKNALINLISKYFESIQMDAMIRSSKINKS